MEFNAFDIVRRELPDGKIYRHVEYKNYHLFMVFTPEADEGTMDSIYSVDKNTGEFRDFPYMKEDVFSEIMELFTNSPVLEEV